MQILWASGKHDVSFPAISTTLLPVNDYRMNVVHEDSILGKLSKN